MQPLQRVLERFPSLKKISKSLFGTSPGLPPVAKKVITKDIVKECVGKPNPTILEIGCNDGTHTGWFLDVFENPTIYCFEPDPRAITRFKQNVGQRPNVTLFEIALSDKNGETTFYQSSGQNDEATTPALPEGWDYSGSIRPPKDHLRIHPWVTFGERITVETSTIDSWCSRHGVGHIDFIWMDVQGAEIDVFRGGGATLANTRFLYTEYSNKELFEGQYDLAQLLAYLRDYDVLVRYSDDVLLKNRRFPFTQTAALQQMIADAHR
ncbi:MAG: FkbM family methyltransferase [Pseudomonadota bacterium]